MLKLEQNRGAINISRITPPRGRAESPLPEWLTGELASGRKRIGIWGLGYLGYHNLVQVLTRRLSAAVTDEIPERLTLVRTRGFVEEVLRNYYGFSMADSTQGWTPVEVLDGDSLGQRPDVGVHIICVPAEVDGRPSDEPLLEVVQRIANGCSRERQSPLLVVVESFAIPGVVDRVVKPAFIRAGLAVGRDVCLGVAPRLDYGRSPFASQSDQVRVVGGVTPRCREMLQAFYEFMGNEVQVANSPWNAELASMVHRGAEHLLLSYANQLALAFGQTDMTEVMSLADALGAVNLSRPSLGSSGYFLPVSAHHLRASSTSAEMLTLLDETFRCDLMMSGVVADRLMEADAQRVAILGLASQTDVKNHVHSPSVKLAGLLRSRGNDVRMCDPLYTSEEIESIAKCRSADWPEGLGECDAVVLATAHHPFQVTGGEELICHLASMKLVLDCTGAWAERGLRATGVNYFALGQAGWAG